MSHQALGETNSINLSVMVDIIIIPCFIKTSFCLVSSKTSKPSFSFFAAFMEMSTRDFFCYSPCSFFWKIKLSIWFTIWTTFNCVVVNNILSKFINWRKMGINMISNKYFWSLSAIRIHPVSMFIDSSRECMMSWLVSRPSLFIFDYFRFFSI